MNRRRKPIPFFRIAVLVTLIGIAVYVNEVIIPTVPPPFVPTPTATRPPEAYEAEARQFFAQGQLPQAIEAYRQAIKATPDDPTIYIALARVQVFAGQYAQAQISAESALLLSPDNATAHAVRGWTLDFQQDYLAAEASIKRALELDPNNPLAHAYYAEVLADQYLTDTGPLDAIDRAVEESRIAVSLAPDTLEAHRARGYVLEITANYEDALREYQAAAAINDNLADIYLHIGYNYSALGAPVEAVAALTRADTLNPSDPTPDLAISRIYARIGEYVKAEQFAERAVKDDPTSAALHGNLGVMNYRNFNWLEAEAQLAIAVRGGGTADGQPIQPLQLVNNDPRLAEYFWTYGLVLVRLNKCGEALPILRDVLQRVPNDEIATVSAQKGLDLCAAAIGTGTPAPTATATLPPP
jgi:tetratricopeptide (TPR) repeat protein